MRKTRNQAYAKIRPCPADAGVLTSQAALQRASPRAISRRDVWDLSRECAASCAASRRHSIRGTRIHRCRYPGGALRKTHVGRACRADGCAHRGPSYPGMARGGSSGNAGRRAGLPAGHARSRSNHEKGALPADCSVLETTGGIGYQRQQLGEFLRGLPAQQGIIGYHANGVPLYKEIGGFCVGQPVWIAYRARSDLAPVSGEIDELFIGPVGPTACVRIKDPSRGPREHPEWVDLRDLKAR